MATPRTTASSITRTVAINVIERVIMASCQRPVQKMTPRQTAEITAGCQPPST